MARVIIMDSEKIIENIRKYLDDKLELDKETAYFITKSLNEQYWDDIQDGSDGEDEDYDIEDDEDSEEESDDYEDSEEDEGVDDFDAEDDQDSEEIDIPKTKVQDKKQVKEETDDEYNFDEPSSIIKRPKVKVRE